MRYRFYNQIHVIDHQDSSTYAFEFYKNLNAVRGDQHRISIPGRRTVPGFEREGYRTDFASIPGRKSLKKLMEPQNLKRADKVDPTIKWAVWVYHIAADGSIFLYGYFIDRIAYAAVVHDWLFSTRMVSVMLANNIFFEILRCGDVWYSGILYSGVVLLGWYFYNGYPSKEVAEDRDLGRLSMYEFLNDVPQLEDAVPYMDVST